MNHHTHEIKTYLETLTTAELLKMADTMGIDVPPDLERIFIIQELLEADADFDIEEHSADSEITTGGHIRALELVPLPKQYNVNYLEVLLRDPLWAFVYWEINSIGKKAYESSPGFKEYVLHVIPLPVNGGSSSIEPFTISVSNDDNSWRIYLPPDTKLFQVKLCASRGESNEVIISSKEIAVPQVLNPDDKSVKNIPKYPILSLSGIEEFEILRNIDKVPRTHRFLED
jgi:hypothetical protein